MTASHPLRLSPNLFKVNGFEYIRHILCDNDSIQASIKPCIVESIMERIERLNHAFSINMDAVSSEKRFFGS
jgi:hypothetical protein